MIHAWNNFSNIIFTYRAKPELALYPLQIKIIMLEWSLKTLIIWKYLVSRTFPYKMKFHGRKQRSFYDGQRYQSQKRLFSWNYLKFWNFFVKYWYNLDFLSSEKKHCVKNVRNQCYSGPYFAAFGLNTERYLESFRIQSKCGKIRTRITPNTDIFCAVNWIRFGLLVVILKFPIRINFTYLITYSSFKICSKIGFTKVW